MKTFIRFCLMAVMEISFLFGVLAIVNTETAKGFKELLVSLVCFVILYSMAHIERKRDATEKIVDYNEEYYGDMGEDFDPRKLNNKK